MFPKYYWLTSKFLITVSGHNSGISFLLEQHSVKVMSSLPKSYL